MRTTRASGAIGSAFLVAAPVALIGIAACGAIYALAAHFSPWAAITNPIAQIILSFAIGFCSIQAARVGKLRNTPVALLFGFIGLAMFLGTSLFTLQALAGYNGTVWAFLAERKNAGIPLFGNARVGGVWLIVAWVFHVLLALFVTVAAVVEVDRPFCEQCKTWAWKSRWTFKLRGPAEHTLDRLKAEKTLDALTDVWTGGDPTQILRCQLGACKCGQRATLAADMRKLDDEGHESSGAEILTDLPIYASSAGRLFDWAESIDPAMAQRRPILQLAALESSASVDDLPYPEGEPRARRRLVMNISDAVYDTDFTKALRKRIEQEGHAPITSALERARNNDDRAFIAEACADWMSRPVWIDVWAGIDEDDPNLRLIRGIINIKWAWDARGAGWEPKNFDTFQNRLIDAENDLHRAGELRPDDPTPWAWLILSGTGRQLSKQDLLDRYKESHKRERFFRLAATFMTGFALTPKWGGTPEKLEEFARKITSSAPDGLHAHVVAPDAARSLAENLVIQANGKNANAIFGAYFQRSEVRQLLAEANRKCFRKGALTPNMITPGVRENFAHALWEAGLTKEARDHFEALGPKHPAVYFSRLPFSKHSYRRARRECGA